jgi:hypothetical protein
MNTVKRSAFIGGLAIALFALVPITANAVELTLKQERLIGMPNRFTVEVPEFEPDGPFTALRAKTFAEKVMKISGLELVQEGEASTPAPLGKVVVSIMQDENGNGDRIYVLDLNVYNIETINTEYDLRKGTVWKIGSYRETPGKKFPRGIEDRIAKLIRYFSYDFFQANPYLKQPKQKR